MSTHRGWVSDRRKLSDAQILTIRTTDTPLRHLARAMNISHVAVWSARKHYTYKVPRR